MLSALLSAAMSVEHWLVFTLNFHRYLDASLGRAPSAQNAGSRQCEGQVLAGRGVPIYQRSARAVINVELSAAMSVEHWLVFT